MPVWSNYDAPYMKQTPLLPILLASAALHAQAVPAPMEVTAHESATIWTQGYGVGNGRLGALSYGEFPKEILVLNEESIFAKSSIVPREGAAEGLKEARGIVRRGVIKRRTKLSAAKSCQTNPPPAATSRAACLTSSGRICPLPLLSPESWT